MSFSLSQWWHDLIDHLFKHPQAETVAHPAIAAVALAAAPVQVPTVSGAHDDTVLNAFLGRTAQTDAILNAAVANQPKGDPGWQAGTVLDAFGVGLQNDYTEGKPFAYSVNVPAQNFAGGGFEFVWSDCPGTPAGSASVVVSGPAGIFSGSSFLKLGSVKVPGAKPGESYTATLTASVSGPGHAQINPL